MLVWHSADVGAPDMRGMDNGLRNLAGKTSVNACLAFGRPRVEFVTSKLRPYGFASARHAPFDFFASYRHIQTRVLCLRTLR